MCEWWRKLSRAKTLLMWTSTTGTATAATASPEATEAGGYAPALVMMPAGAFAGGRARVDDEAGGLFGGGLVDQVHDLALVVRLAEFDRELMAPRGFAAKLLH